MSENHFHRWDLLNKITSGMAEIDKEVLICMIIHSQIQDSSQVNVSVKEVIFYLSTRGIVADEEDIANSLDVIADMRVDFSQYLH
jgi:hypothetical protein